jgi:valyl-tRNA synthetase
VAKTADEALAKFKASNPQSNFTVSDLKQDEDVLDTWFSSWLWPISVFDGFKEKNNKDIAYYYPTNDLVTAPEIMFFWVARMIMAGYEWMGKKPFSNVYYTGIVRDKQRRKMSKSLGNSPDPLDLIEKYGADGVRMGMLLCSPAGNDILFDESLVEQGRNFTNKIWNAFRLVKGWEVKPDNTFDDEVISNNALSTEWFEARLNEVLLEIDHKYTDYKLSEVLMSIYKLIWDDFCSWYLEMIKPAFGQPINESTYQQTILFFEKLMKVLHPFMPFITEEVWQNISSRKQGESICVATYPLLSQQKPISLQRTFEAIVKIREMRNSKGLSPKEAFDISIHTQHQEAYESTFYLIKKLANVSSISFAKEKPADSIVIPSGTDEIYAHLKLEIDAEAEKEKLSKELSYLEGFLKSVEAKLSNEKFVANAKAELIEKERQKKADAETKIDLLKRTLGM